ncbi:MAG: fatty acid desaturase [Deltaproteobacteria bacterium]|nr:fatty acid desaturase [Deltaproteobacteria bacterium]
MAEPRRGKKLIVATKPFEKEDKLRSWGEIAVTFFLYGVCLVIAASDAWFGLRVAATLLAGALQFRFFALYHDHVHGALLAHSKVARRLLSTVGLFILAPRPVWKETHDFHHWNNGKIDWMAIGSYPVLTVKQLQEASPEDRRKYLRTRHPIAIFSGYFTVGIKGMCIQAYQRSPKRHWRGPIALGIHVLGFVGLAIWLGPLVATLTWLLPTVINQGIASYLFYAQHNFPGTKLFMSGAWDYTEAALVGSSFIAMSRPMHWLTCNIGYHHVHHLNSKIPFYRLPEAMAGLEELRNPTKTSLRPRDMLACLRLKCWDPDAGEMKPEPRLPRAA